jgi:hypothetical protein
LLGGSADVVVTLSGTMPNNTYNVRWLAGPGLINNYSSIVVKTKTTSQVTLTVTAGLAIALGAIVYVIVYS